MLFARVEIGVTDFRQKEPKKKKTHFGGPRFFSKVGAHPRCRQCNSALGTGTHSPAEGRHWATECPAEGRHGLHWGTGVPAEGRHWPALGPAEGRHWPALGARRSAGLPAEGRRWLGRRPGTAARAVCARRSEQCAMYGARLSSMRTLYILLYILLYGSIRILRYIYEY